MADLKKIAEELHQLRRRHSADTVAIGGLLAAARKQLPHGEWRSWLRQFGWSKSSASRFIRVHERFGKGSEMSQVGTFELAPSTLCLLAEEKTPPEAVKAVLDVVKTGAPLAHKEAVRIVKEARADKKPPPSKSHDAPAPLRDARAVEAFRDAIASLSKVAAKPAAIFVGITPAHELVMLANFLTAIADAERKAA